MSIAQSTGLGNQSHDPAGTPQHYHYWRECHAIEWHKSRRWPQRPNPELAANVGAYWSNLFAEGNNGSSTETT